MLFDSAITCKMRWNNIRDNYRKSLKKRVMRSGLTGQPRKRRYKYENQLTFLLPFIRERDPNHAGSIREGDEVPTADESDETPLMKRDDNRDSQTRPAASSEMTEDKTSKSNGEESTVKTEQNESGLIIPESTNSRSAGSNDRKLQVASSHSVDTFLASLAPTLKSLSPYYLNVTKTKIFSIVQKVEMIQILKRQQQARKRRATSTPNQSDTSSLSIPSMSPPSSDLSPLFAQRISETN